MRLLPALLLCSSLLVAQTGEKDPPNTGEEQGGLRRVRGSNITLPPTAGQPKRAQANPAREFEADIRRLRQAMQKDGARVSEALRDLATHGKPADKAMLRFAGARVQMVPALMLVVERFGSARHAAALDLELRKRNLRAATAPVVKACLAHSGERAKERLFAWLESRHGTLRRVAQEELTVRLGAVDVPRLLALAGARNQDVQRRSMELMARLPDPRVRQHLVTSLGASVAMSRIAYRSLLEMGAAARPDLEAAVSAEAAGWPLALLAICQLDAERSEARLPAAWTPRLVAGLRGGPGVLQVAAAVALGEASWRGQDLPEGVTPQELVAALLEVVAPERFVSGLSLLKPPAHRALVRLAGVDHGTGLQTWRTWWKTGAEGFVALRNSLQLDASTAPAAQLRFQAEQNLLIFHGPEGRPADLPPGARSYFLVPAELQALVAELRQHGFMAGRHTVLQQGEVWELELRVGRQRVLERRPAARPGPEAQAIRDRLTGLARQELWQLYRPAEQDPRDFWMAEKGSFRGAASRARLVQLIVQALAAKDAAGRKTSLDDLMAIDHLERYVTPDLGVQLVNCVKSLQSLDASDFRMLEVALLAKGGEVWRQALNTLPPHLEGAGSQLISRFFALLGPERVALAVLHPNRRLALAATHDVAANRIHAAAPHLRKLLGSPHLELVSTAVYALGILHAKEAVADLVALEPRAPASLRREIWKALCRLDDPAAVPLVRAALRSQDSKDQLAALAAMGLSRRPEFANRLAARFVSVDHSEGGMLSRRAELSLRQMGPLLAAPALRPHLQMQAGPELDRLILMLGSFQDPVVVPQLIEMLRRPKQKRIAQALLQETTGVDLGPLPDPARGMTAWFATRGKAGQGQWFLDALRVAQIDTSLRVEDLRPDAAAPVVEELARLLEQANAPQLRVLAGALLRSCTGQDYTRGVLHADAATLRSMADRYRFHAAALRKR